MHEQSLLHQENDAKQSSFTSDPAEIEQEAKAAHGSIEVSPLFSAQLDAQEEDLENSHLENRHDSKVLKHQPDTLIFDQEPTPVNISDVRHDTDEESTTEENGATNILQVQQPPVNTGPTSLPGAFAVEGPHFNSQDHNNFNLPESYENQNEVLVHATLVEDPPPETEVYTAYAEPLLPFREKYKWHLRGGFSAAIIVLVVVLAIAIPTARRKNSMTSIALQTSNQTSTNMLGVAQRQALNWVLGPNNSQYDPTRDRNQIAQRYILATLYYSTGGGNWTQNSNMLSKDDECNWYESVICSQAAVTTIQLENNNVQGTLPSEIGVLEQLQHLKLGQNNISGAIASELNSLKNLQELNLTKNGFAGDIPRSMGDLQNLTLLDVSHKKLAGGDSNRAR